MITEGQVLDIAKDAIYYIIICSAPVLIISLVVLQQIFILII
jgi:flagellar biosynthetic protein FliQ